MKKILLSLILLLAICINIFAQDVRARSKFGFGIIGGANIFGTYQIDAPMKYVGVGMIGLDLNYAFVKKDPNSSLHFQPNWEKFTYRISNDIGDNHLVFKSLNFPVFYRYKFSTSKWFQPFIELGLSYKLRLKSAYGGWGRNCGPFAGAGCVEYNYMQDLVEESKKNNAVMLVGVGTNFKFGAVHVPISIRFNEGIMVYTLKDSQRESKSFTDLKTRTIQVVAGITF